KLPSLSLSLSRSSSLSFFLCSNVKLTCEPGRCSRLYSVGAYERMPINTIPELMRTHLVATVLKIRQMGFRDQLSRFDFLSQPSPISVQKAVESLINIGALDEQENITADGQLFLSRPLAPENSKLIIEGMRNGVLISTMIIA